MRWTFAIAVILWSIPAEAEECASTLADLKKTPNLELVLTLFKDSPRVGMVNGTNGSYVIIDAVDGDLKIYFYTSGLWDLFGIKDDGPLTFCDGPEGLRMSGLGRSEYIKLVYGAIQLGEGGPRRTFRVGAMPEILQKLHGLNGREIASKP